MTKISSNQRWNYRKLGIFRKFSHFTLKNSAFLNRIDSKLENPQKMRFWKFQLNWLARKILKQPELKYARLGVPYCTYLMGVDCHLGRRNVKRLHPKTFLGKQQTFYCSLTPHFPCFLSLLLLGWELRLVFTFLFLLWILKNALSWDVSQGGLVGSELWTWCGGVLNSVRAVIPPTGVRG